MDAFVITVDIDWACEAAIEETLDFLRTHPIPSTLFTTHRSPAVEASLNEFDVGLHPFFDPTSSHGATIPEVVRYVMDLPHNLPAFRCHRYAHCNTSQQAMQAAGMQISSNVCTDLEIVPPFKNRIGLLEVPIFLEDGGYLWHKHPLEITPDLEQKMFQKGPKVINIHPMHFAINTPHFEYMAHIKKRVNRLEWQSMSKKTLSSLRWKGRGIRDLIVEMLQAVPKISLRSVAAMEKSVVAT